MGNARGVRLSKQRIREIGWFESDAGAALACLQAQSYVPSSGGTDPERLLAQERFVARSTRVVERIDRISEVRVALNVGGDPTASDGTAHWARVARVCQYLWQKVKGEPLSERDKVFGLDLVPIVSETRSALARARLAWPRWVCGERPWITARSRPITEMAESLYEGDIERAKDEHPNDAPWAARTACMERFDLWDQQGQFLDSVVLDVIEHAIGPQTYDEALVGAIRNEADELLSASSLIVQGAWNAIDGRHAVAEERSQKGDVEAGAQRVMRLERMLGPAPKTTKSRADRLGELVALMRAGGS